MRIRCAPDVRHAVQASKSRLDAQKNIMRFAAHAANAKENKSSSLAQPSKTLNVASARNAMNLCGSRLIVEKRIMFKGKKETYQWFANIVQKKINLKEAIVNLRKEQYLLHVINVPQINTKLNHVPSTKTQSAMHVLTVKTDNSE